MYAARACVNLLMRRPGVYASQRWQQTAALVAKEPFLNGSSSNYVEEMYSSWLEDPKSVHRVSSFTTKQYGSSMCRVSLLLASRL